MRLGCLNGGVRLLDWVRLGYLYSEIRLLECCQWLARWNGMDMELHYLDLIVKEDDLKVQNEWDDDELIRSGFNVCQGNK